MEEIYHCSFCKRSSTVEPTMIAGSGALICERCIIHASEVVQRERAANKVEKTVTINLLPPQVLKDHLDEYVVGQDEAKKVLSTAVYNHYKRLQQVLDDDVCIEKSNILLIGETGSGKTYLVRILSQILQVPFCIVDATMFTEAGYVGEDVESIITRLLHVADYDIHTAERGIVYIDEIDKIARKGDNPSITRDVSGEGVQQALLKLLEGNIVNVPPQGGRKHPEQKMVPVNTENILFICGGSFDGITKVISRRINIKQLGFDNNLEKKYYNKMQEAELLKYVSSVDIKNYGLIPELVGRLPVIKSLEHLNKKHLVCILKQPKNALIKQYVKLFAMDGLELSFTDEALDYIADQTILLNLGARGLRTICELIMSDAMFYIPSQTTKKSLIIDKSYVIEQLSKVALHTLKSRKIDNEMHEYSTEQPKYAVK